MLKLVVLAAEELATGGSRRLALARRALCAPEQSLRRLPPAVQPQSYPGASPKHRYTR